MKRAQKVVIALAIGGILIAGGAIAVLGRSKGASSKGDTVTVKRGVLEITVAETGIIQPLTKVEVKSRIAGQVAKIFVDVGDRVKPGEDILQLDTRDSDRAMEQSAADVEVAKSQLAKLKAGPRREERAEWRAEVNQAEAEKARTQTDFRRSEIALRNGSLTVREADQVRGDFHASAARLATVQARATRLLAGARAEDISEASAVLARAQVGLQAARDQVMYATIRSPMHGVVIKRGVEVGEFVSPGVSALAQGGAILTIANLSKLIIKSQLNQVDVGKVREGLAVEVRVDSAPGRTFRGKIRKVAPAAEALENDKKIQAFSVETIIGEGEADATILRPGMTADLDIKVKTLRDVLVLPVEAVVRGRGDEGSVNIPTKAKKGKPETRKIKLGLANDHQVEVVSGLKVNDVVALKPPSADENQMKF